MFQLKFIVMLAVVMLCLLIVAGCLHVDIGNMR